MSHFIIGFTSLAQRLCTWKGSTSFPGVLDHEAPGLQESMLQDEGPFGSLKCWKALCLVCSYYSVVLHGRMDRKTGSSSDETKIKDFIRILMCGQQQRLGIVLL